MTTSASFASPSAWTGNSHNRQGMNSGKLRTPPRRIILNMPSQDVQLKTSANAWKPGLRRQSPVVDPKVQNTEELLRKVRSLLNKMTPEKFDRLMTQITDLDINTEERLKGVVDLVFEKAIAEPVFAGTYAKMCCSLATLKVQMEDDPNNTVPFRRLLLRRCRAEFQREKEGDAELARQQKERDSAASSTERKRVEEELKQAQAKARRCSIGNVTFIGELFRLNMLSAAIMLSCVEKLLNSHDEESLECLCKLLTTIGKDIDSQETKPQMDHFYIKMEMIIKERQTTSRIRFLLQDVLDLRSHNWVSRRASQGPKTIQEIHMAARMEEQENARQVNQKLLSTDRERKREQQVRGEKQRELREREQQEREQRQREEQEREQREQQAIEQKQRELREREQQEREQREREEQERAQKQRELRERAQQERELQEREQQERELRERALRERERQEREQRQREEQERAQKQRELRERELREREQQERDQREREEQERELRERELRERAQQERELRERALRERERQEREQRQREEQERAQKQRELRERELRERELQERELRERALRERERQEREQRQREEQERAQKQRELRERELRERELHEREQLEKELQEREQQERELRERALREREQQERELQEREQQEIEQREQQEKKQGDQRVRAKRGRRQRKQRQRQRDQRESGQREQQQREETCHSQPMSKSSRSMEPSNNPQTPKKIKLKSSSPAAAPSAKTFPEELRSQLDRLLLDNTTTDRHIFDWVEANLDEGQRRSASFLRALMTAVCRSAVIAFDGKYFLNPYAMEKRRTVLLQYLHMGSEQQLQALYALQALDVTLGHPPYLLQFFFDWLAEEAVISDNAFYKWQACKDPAEQQGRDEALASLEAFFICLREAREELEVY